MAARAEHQRSRAGLNGVVYQIAYLDCTPGGAWRVTTVSEELHHLEY
jgi:hypothetical protein